MSKAAKKEKQPAEKPAPSPPAEPTADELIAQLAGKADTGAETKTTVEGGKVEKMDDQIARYAQQNLEFRVNAKTFFRFLSYLSCYGKVEGKSQSGVNTVLLHLIENRIQCRAATDNKNVIVFGEYWNVENKAWVSGVLPISIEDFSTAFDICKCEQADEMVTIRYSKHIYTLQTEFSITHFPGPNNVKHDFDVLWERKRRDEKIEAKDYISFNEKKQSWANFNGAFNSDTYIEVDSAGIRNTISTSSKITGKNFRVSVDPDEVRFRIKIDAVDGKWKAEHIVPHRKMLTESKEPFEKVYVSGFSSVFNGISGFISIALDSKCQNDDFNYMIVETTPHSDDLKFRITYAIAHRRGKE